FGIGNAWRIFHIIGFYGERNSTDLVRQLGTNRRATACRLLANSEPARSWQAVDELPQKTIALNISTNYQFFFPRARERRKEKKREE
ncbi:hypothetical protein, partial [Bacteroides heparinolyticus]|uniref:hypothetical protein n=1 Tax=Prevotella heparinolytica TaxID=28113 RepID=UPI0035A05938